MKHQLKQLEDKNYNIVVYSPVMIDHSKSSTEGQTSDNNDLDIKLSYVSCLLKQSKILVKCHMIALRSGSGEVLSCFKINSLLNVTLDN